jgi:hypothetical protein
MSDIYIAHVLSNYGIVPSVLCVVFCWTGFLEWPLKYRPKPANVVVLELSLSMDRVSPYASVKPVAL